MTHTELAWQFADIFDELGVEQINEMLAKNVPLETLEFFRTYGEEFGSGEGLNEAVSKRLPNLLLVGYLIRVLEDRLLHGEEEPSA